MAVPETISAFLAFCAQRNPRFVHPIPQRTPYEQMLHDLDNGDPAVLTAFNWARQTQNASDEAVRAEWRRYAQTERASIRRHVAVAHELAAPPAPQALETLRATLDGASPELYELYRRHDGAGLFVDREDGGNGLFLFPLAELDAERDNLGERLEGPLMETVEDGRLQVYGRPDWIDTAVVFAGFGYAPERLLLPTRGEHRGSVFLFCHDPQQLVQLAPDFGALLEQLRNQPVTLLGSYGGASYQNASHFEADAAGNRE
ncbi:MAG: SMI1/KNR4 family protein [Nevskia sp.]|nr:SMI1/KNR4 family protein [Nevskia sp.]